MEWLGGHIIGINIWTWVCTCDWELRLAFFNGVAIKAGYFT